MIPPEDPCGTLDGRRGRWSRPRSPDPRLRRPTASTVRTRFMATPSARDARPGTGADPSGPPASLSVLLFLPIGRRGGRASGDSGARARPEARHGRDSSLQSARASHGDRIQTFENASPGLSRRRGASPVRKMEKGGWPFRHPSCEPSLFIDIRSSHPPIRPGLLAVPGLESHPSSGIRDLETGIPSQVASRPHMVPEPPRRMAVMVSPAASERSSCPRRGWPGMG